MLIVRQPRMKKSFSIKTYSELGTTKPHVSLELTGTFAFQINWPEKMTDKMKRFKRWGKNKSYKRITLKLPSPRPENLRWKEQDLTGEGHQD